MAPNLSENMVSIFQVSFPFKLIMDIFSNFSDLPYFPSCAHLNHVQFHPKMSNSFPLYIVPFISQKKLISELFELLM